MNSKILFWFGDSFLHYGLAKHLKQKINCDIFAIADVNDSSKEFYKNQTMIPEDKIWYYPDHLESFKNPDLIYLKNFLAL